MVTNRLARFDQAFLRDSGLPVMTRPVRFQSLVRAMGYALQGLRDAWRSQPHLRLHVYFGSGMVALGALCRLSVAEWLWVLFAVGLVIFAELMNTTIEQAVDLVVGLRPDPLARRIKDIAAGAVLVAAILAALIESLTFLPHLLRG